MGDVGRGGGRRGAWRGRGRVGGGRGKGQRGLGKGVMRGLDASDVWRDQTCCLLRGFGMLRKKNKCHDPKKTNESTNKPGASKKASSMSMNKNSDWMAKING